MSMHKDFIAPLHQYTDISPETIDYHVARARVIRSQVITSQLKSLFAAVGGLFTRQKSEADPVGYAANQT